MSTTFQWTEQLVKEFAEQYRFSSSRISIEQFKESKQPKPEWEIIQVATPDHSIYYLEGCKICPIDKIYSVKRLSDHLIVTIGDLLEHRLVDAYFKVDHFEIEGNEIYAVNDEPDFSSFKRKSFSCRNWGKVKEILFTTEDGISIYEGMEYWDVSDNFEILWTSHASDIYPSAKVRAFSTQAKASEFVLMNKPLFSINDITDTAGPTLYQAVFINKAKEKLKK